MMQNTKHKYFLSLLLYLFSHLILVYYLLEISQPFRCVVKHILLFDALSHDLVENDLETYRDTTAFQIGIVVLSYFFDFRVFLGHAFVLRSSGLLHEVTFKIIYKTQANRSN